MELDQNAAAGKVAPKGVSHESIGNGGTGACRIVELRTKSMLAQERALKTSNLMEDVVKPENLNLAYKRVTQNKGAAGMDGMKTTELKAWLKENGSKLIKELLEGSYEAMAVKRVDIPKPNGGTRELSIPTVVDRFVQQAILQVLTPIIDPEFSDSSYGFRPNRSAHQALEKAQEYVEGGRSIVVDIDLERFFDTVNHDVLMGRLAKRIGDKRILLTVRKFLQAGIMHNGVCMDKELGTPQGGPLSPLLANVLLDDLDKELERRGHKFVRYADDCNIYVTSMKAGERVMESVTLFLKKTLRLIVNQQKSQVSPCRNANVSGVHDSDLGNTDDI